MNKKVYIKQDGTIPGRRIIEELEKRGGKLTNVIDYDSIFEVLGVYYYIEPNDNIYIASDLISDEYTELLYDKETDTFYEKNQCSDCHIKDKLFISEGKYNIPEGYEATIEDGKVIVKKKGWPPKEGDIVYFPCANTYHSEKIHFSAYNTCYHYGCRIDKAIMFVTEEDCKAFCEKLDAVINPLIENRRKEVEG